MENIYEYLSDVEELEEKDYKRLVSIYGTNYVNSVIERIIDKDEQNVFKFEYYINSLTNNIVDISNKSVYHLYLSDVGSTPYFNREQNFEYANKIYFVVEELKKIFSADAGFKYIKHNGVMFNSIVDEVEAYLYWCQDEEKLSKVKFLYNEFLELRNKLVEGNVRLVLAVASVYHKDDESYLDIIQYGNIGLMKAVEKYNPNYNTTFSTYAYYWIRSFFRSAQKKSLYTGVSVSYPMLEKNNLRLRIIDKLSVELGRVPERFEVAEEMGITIEELEKIEMSVRYGVSLSTKISINGDDDGSLTVMEMCKDDTINVSEEVCTNLLNEELRSELLKIIDIYLNPRQKFIVLNRYGFYGEIMTLQELSVKFGISKQCVEQEQKRSLTKIKRRAGKDLARFI